MSTSTPSAIRLTITKEVSQALKKAKEIYPTLSDAEILKLGLSKIVREVDSLELQQSEKLLIRESAARAVGMDYISDPEEDLYQLKNPKKTNKSNDN